mmetsp:Transcript_25230/g.69361  ORF Transcript_25230/g.69361 Transcript_25230/m.69361 type:complete len:347 (-) Transcript_25230:124-1164(-)
MPLCHRVLVRVEGPLVVPVLRELGVRSVPGGVPQIPLQSERIGPVDGLHAHGLRLLAELLQEFDRLRRLHVGPVLQVRHTHAEDIRLAVLQALLQEDLEVRDARPREGPDIGPKGRIGDAADGGGHLLFQHTVGDIDEGLVREFRVVHVQLRRRVIDRRPATAHPLVLVSRWGNAQAALRVVHQLSEPAALPKLRRGHLRGVAEGAHAAEQHARHLLVECGADLFQHWLGQLEVVRDKNRVLDAWEAPDRELGVPQVVVLGARLRGLRVGALGFPLSLFQLARELPQAVIVQKGGFPVLRQRRQWPHRNGRSAWHRRRFLRRSLAAARRMHLLGLHWRRARILVDQ